MSLLVACGGKSNSSSREAPVYKVTGTVEISTFEDGEIVPDSETPFAGALVSIDGIQATSLSNDQGVFTVESSLDFDTSAVVTATKDGYEPFNLHMDLTTSTENAYKLDDNISMLEVEPWGYLDINVSPAQTSAQASAYNSAAYNRSPSFASKQNFSISKSLAPLPPASPLRLSK